MASFQDLPIRDDLRDLTPYGAPQLEVRIPVNVNENNYGIPDEVVASIATAVNKEIAGLNRYPDREFSLLRERIATYIGQGVNPDQIWAANGSNEVLQQLFMAFGGPGRRVVSFSPTYSMYPLIAKSVGSEYLAIPRAEDFSLPENFAALLTDAAPDITIICRPNNPTGTNHSLEEIVEIYSASKGMVIVDEAYQEFSELPSAVQLLPERNRLVVLRTMSKAFSYAGTRLGYLVADSIVSDALRLVRLPYHLSALTQAAAIASIDHADALLASVEAIKNSRQELVNTLPSMGLSAYPSSTNFVLIDGFKDPKATFTALLEKGILVRNVGIGNTLRISVGTEAEIAEIIETLAKLQDN